MDFYEYEENCHHTDVGTSAQDSMSPGWLYYVLGIAGESGELCEKVKKLFRDKGGVVDDEFKEMLIKESGDVLWYLTRLADQFGIRLEDIAIANSKKLLDRMRRGVIHGDGDDR
jgi:NTP pyrophosphatase (non-canonical NTP hydrolase)